MSLFKKLRALPRQMKLTLLLLLTTAAGITMCGICFHQQFWRMIPLYISLFVMLLNSRVNRYALLIGAFNSLFYAAVYWYDGLYGMMTSAVAISFTMQIATFFLWSRKPYGLSTVFRRLTGKQRLFVLIGTLPVAVAAILLLQYFNASSSLLDGLITVLAILASLFQMLSFMEYAVVNAASGILQIVLYAMMLPTQPEQSTFLVYNIYCLYCIIQTALRLRTLYREQQIKKE